MKKLLLLLLIALVFCCEARPPRRISPRPKPRKPFKEYVQKVNWKHIAAGGAAAGTVVAAYKISDGVQEGMERAGAGINTLSSEGGSEPMKILLTLVLMLCLAFPQCGLADGQ